MSAPLCCRSTQGRLLPRPSRLSVSLAPHPLDRAGWLSLWIKPVISLDQISIGLLLFKRLDTARRPSLDLPASCRSPPSAAPCRWISPPDCSPRRILPERPLPTDGPCLLLPFSSSGGCRLLRKPLLLTRDCWCNRKKKKQHDFACLRRIWTRYLYHGIHEIHGLVITNHASHLLLGGNPPIAIP